MSQYYTVDDIVQITGYVQNKAYAIIRELNKKYKKEYPDAILMRGRIPRWFYDEKMGTNKEGKVKNERGE